MTTNGMELQGADPGRDLHGGAAYRPSGHDDKLGRRTSTTRVGGGWPADREQQ